MADLQQAVQAVRDAFKKLTEAHADAQFTSAILGVQQSDGTYKLVAPLYNGNPNFQTATVNAGTEKSTITVVKCLVTPKAGFPVKLRKTKDNSIVQYEAVDADGQAGLEFIGEYGGGFTPPFSQQIGSGLEEVIQMRRLEAGLVSVYGTGTTLTVAIKPLHYLYNSTHQWYAGGTLDLTSNVPASGLCRMVKIAIDATTNTAVALNGATKGVAFFSALNENDLTAISSSTHVLLCGIKLRYGMTAVDKEALFFDAGAWRGTVSGSSSGTVTSVALTATPTGIFDVSGSPVTSSGTLALSMDNQTGNSVLASPADGSSGQPAFRALVADDVPNIDDLNGALSHTALSDLTTGDPHTQYVALAPTTDARNTVQPSASTVTPLTLKGAASQSDPLLSLQDDAGTVLGTLNANGGATFNENGADADVRIEGDTDTSLLLTDASQDAVGIGGTPAASAKLDVASTTKGFLPPRMTTAQREAISATDGLEVYDTDLDKPTSYQNGAWKEHAAPSVNLMPNHSLEIWENGISSPPDNWEIDGAGATVARSTTHKHGSYSAALTRVGTDCKLIGNFLPTLGGDVAYTASRKFTISAWVYATQASRARVTMWDGVSPRYSAYHSGGSTWEWLTLTMTIDAAPTFIKAGLAINGGNTTAYIDGITVTEGTGTDYTQPNTMPFNRFPTRATLWHDEALVIAGNAIAYTVQTAAIYNGAAFQNAGAQNDEFTHSFWLEAGTYTLSALGNTNTSRGIVTWYIDEVSQGTQDWYAAALNHNVVKTTSVTVIGSGYHVLRGKVATKNASSSGYVMVLTKYWFEQSAD